MPLDLANPLRWSTATGEERTLLENLQPNIVKAHVRDSLHVLFLRFDDQQEGRSFLAGLAPLMKSALTHLREVAAFKAGGPPGTPYVGVGLSKAGYAALGIGQVPADSSFRRGMKSPDTRVTLNDPPVSVWEEPYREDLHAVVLVGDSSDAASAATYEAVLALLPDSVTVVGQETGASLTNDNGDGIEHFGYVDGRSQPLFLLEDIDAERDLKDGITPWDPSFGLDRVLVADPAAPDPTLHFGSYFIFRKLEQDVRRFKQAEQDLADALGLEDDDRERAGAMLVGRFEDGTPLTLQAAEGAHHPVMNSFTYDGDRAGLKCPFSAHIRKTNPRGTGGAQPPEQERLHLMARRGQTYGHRLDDPTDGSVPPSGRPTGGVGLLFMAFNANVSIDDDFGLSQFDFTQSVWADNPGFPLGGNPPGLDAVIGQGSRPAQQQVAPWGGPDDGTAATTVTVTAAPQAVHLRGGEYFFMPSLAFLQTLP